jgi:hypothetical protein
MLIESVEGADEYVGDGMEVQERMLGFRVSA